MSIINTALLDHLIHVLLYLLLCQMSQCLTLHPYYYRLSIVLLLGRTPSIVQSLCK